MSIQDICSKINKIFPLENAQQEWDNVGVLIDTGTISKKILLTIDITNDVIDECLEKNINNIISYHPVIFSPLKRLSNTDTVTRLVKNGINVFCPHTSWDDTLNKFLYKLFNTGDYTKNTGKNVLKLQEIIEIVKEKTRLRNIRVARCKDHDMDYIPKYMVTGVGSAFRYHDFTDSVIITGEMSHHCLLHSIKNNNTVILLEHSNSERISLQFIKGIIQLELNEYEITISEKDKDPIEIM